MALLQDGLRESAAAYPSRAAVIARDGVLSYAELERESNRLAAYLHGCGIGPGVRVGLLMRKSTRSVVAMLGVLKAGAAYVPIDWNIPSARARYVMCDCGLDALITATPRLRALERLLPQVPSIRLLLICDSEDTPGTIASRPTMSWKAVLETPAGEVPTRVAESDPAYLLYTSGSTGQPKGVVLSHANATSFVDWATCTLEIAPTDRLANHAPHHFDLSVFDIYGALRRGACVALVPDDLASFPRALAAWMERERISVWYSVPSALIRLLRDGELSRHAFPELRLVLFAGENFPVKHLRAAMERFDAARFFNLYGPTETNVCTYYEVPRPLSPGTTQIPIGKACENVRISAVADDGSPLKPGGIGELYVGGPTVMLGYWGAPEKTAEVLVPDPLKVAAEEHFYRTGDLARLEEDGQYTFVGRRDLLVKSRGYRIGLGEIERTLLEHTGVSEAAVVAVPDEEIGARLEAFVVPSGSSLDCGELGSFCAAWLPRYMIPERFVLCDALPYTSTGKLDRKRLSESGGREDAEPS